MPTRSKAFPRLSGPARMWLDAHGALAFLRSRRQGRLSGCPLLQGMKTSPRRCGPDSPLACVDRRKRVISKWLFKPIHTCPRTCANPAFRTRLWCRKLGIRVGAKFVWGYRAAWDRAACSRCLMQALREHRKRQAEDRPRGRSSMAGSRPGLRPGHRRAAGRSERPARVSQDHRGGRYRHGMGAAGSAAYLRSLVPRTACLSRRSLVWLGTTAPPPRTLSTRTASCHYDRRRGDGPDPEHGPQTGPFVACTRKRPRAVRLRRPRRP